MDETLGRNPSIYLRLLWTQMWWSLLLPSGKPRQSQESSSNRRRLAMGRDCKEDMREGYLKSEGTKEAL